MPLVRRLVEMHGGAAALEPADHPEVVLVTVQIGEEDDAVGHAEDPNPELAQLWSLGGIFHEHAAQQQRPGHRLGDRDPAEQDQWAHANAASTRPVKKPSPWVPAPVRSSKP